MQLHVVSASSAGSAILVARLKGAVLAAGVLAVTLAAQIAQGQPTITNLGALGPGYSAAEGVSIDGRVVVGQSLMPSGWEHAFRWTAQTGMVDLGTLNGFRASAAAASFDGSTIVGTSSRAFRWTVGGLQDLGSLGPPQVRESTAFDVSGDGSVVVGETLVGTFPFPGRRAFRWTSGGMTDLGRLGAFGDSSASGVSGDGGIVVGFSNGSVFRWTAATGMRQLIPNATSSPVISADGHVVCAGPFEPVPGGGRWVRVTDAAGSAPIVGASGVSAGAVSACNADGSMVLANPYYNSTPQVWTRRLGIVPLAQYLEGVGVNLQGWILQQATGVSGDGRAICGSGTFNGEYRAFLVSGLPYPQHLKELASYGSPIGSGSRAFGLSRSGTTAVGHGFASNGAYRAVRWTEGGARDLGTLGGTFSEAYGASGDGLTITGFSQAAGGAGRAFRWTLTRGMEDLGTLGGTDASGQALSADGKVAVGTSFIANNSGRRAFRWREGAGMQNLGTLGRDSDARAVSNDGETVAGFSALSNGSLRAFRWTAAGMEDLGALGGPESRAFAISGDGSTVGGNVLVGGIEHAFRWTRAGGMEDLGTLGGNRIRVNGLSDDGSVAVGTGEGADLTDRAFIWSRSLGLVDLNTYLAGEGISMSGWTLLEARAISADGTAISGVGRLQGALTAFVARGISPGCREIVLTESLPAETIACRGSSATLRVAAASPTPISYQWFRNGELIPGAISPTYTTPIVDDRNDGDRLLCQLTNGCTTLRVASTVSLSGSILTEPSTPNLEQGPPAEVTYSVTMSRPGNYQYRWRVAAGAPGVWIPLDDGRAFDGLDYAGTRTSTLRVTRGAGWRFRTFSCVVTTPCGELASNSADLRFPFLIVTSGYLEGSGRVEGNADFPTEQVPYVYQTNDSDTIPPFPGISFVRSGGGQTGGGFVGGAYSPTINFSFASQLDNDASGGTLSISMGFSIGGNGYGDCGGQPFSGITMDGVPYTVRWTLCAPSVSGQIFYRNTLTGESGVLSQFGSGYRSVSVNGPPPLCPADINFDGALDPDDLSDFIGCYFSSPSCGFADYNGDGFVDPDDLSDYIGAFFGGC